jgi:hypothetical protein
VFVEIDEVAVYGSEDCGNNWERKGRFLSCGDIGAIAFHPGDADVVLAIEGFG